jgi:hypothetical protein
MRLRNILAAALIAFVVIVLGTSWAHAMTDPTAPPRALLRANVFGADIGIDTEPARPGRPGTVELWVYDTSIEDTLPLLRLVGAPALSPDSENWVRG